MKTIILLLILLFLPFTIAQHKMKIKDRRMNKIEQLERIKLIDVLDLDEETTLRFFARQNKFRNKLEEYKMEGKKYLIKMKSLIASDDKSNELSKITTSYLELGLKVSNEKNDFVNSLSDIFSKKQIAKLLLFEKRFKDDIRRMLFRISERKHGMIP